MTVDRRQFLKVATAGAGLTLAGSDPASANSPKTKPARVGRQAPDIAVVGAGILMVGYLFNLII